MVDPPRTHRFWYYPEEFSVGNFGDFYTGTNNMMGKGVGVGGNIAKSSGAFFFVWTLIALGVTALFSVILSARGLWTLLWGQR
jgi:hypothetical protein